MCGMCWDVDRGVRGTERVFEHHAQVEKRESHDSSYWLLMTIVPRLLSDGSIHVPLAPVAAIVIE